METSLVSIIILTFNSEKFILEAIQSVQNQTYENWELILVDDCSSDNTVAIILEMVEKDDRYIFSA
jgi:glycosyltransferase involved in cell wall biosynthesis